MRGPVRRRSRLGRDERDRENRRLLAAALEMTTPQLESLPEPSESAETATEGEAMRHREASVVSYGRRSGGSTEAVVAEAALDAQLAPNLLIS
jgi:hypothetical protein